MTEDKELLALRIGISMTPGVNASVVRAMEEHGVTPYEFFTLGMGALSERMGAGDTLRLETVARDKALADARRELAFMERYGIRGLYMTDEEYPSLLRETHDAPVLLYVLGAADLNPEQSMAIVGTRKATAYGMNFVGRLCEDLSVYYPELLIVSGLAFGIDTAAHKGALQNGMPTVAIVAHGLDTIYPAQNRGLSKQILEAGGAIVTEYPSGTVPYRRNFLERNRIVAGMTELTVVAESEVKGGAMNTANTAFHNNREVMALPGRVTDSISSGCNHLIRKEKAHLLTCAADIVEMMGWPPVNMKRAPRQRNLFPELEGETKEIYDLVRGAGAPMSVDAIYQKTLINMRHLAGLLTEMEFDGILVKLPGARYEISN